MSNADDERIAPVTYLFGTRPAGIPIEQEGEEVSSPSAFADPGHDQAEPARPGPVFVDLGEPEVAPRVGAASKFSAEKLSAGKFSAEKLSSAGTGSGVDPVRAEIEREAREHVARDRAAEPRKGKGSFERINNVSMHALARRGMSSHEMRDYLVGREFEASEVDVEIERLESVALLDDVALAETLVRTLRDRKGLGKSGLTAELRRRRLDNLAIEIALGEQDDDELERATEIAHKRAAQLRSYDAETAKRRLYAFLQRKGYSGSVVSTAVQRALAPSSGPVFR